MIAVMYFMIYHHREVYWLRWGSSAREWPYICWFAK